MTKNEPAAPISAVETVRMAGGLLRAEDVTKMLQATSAVGQDHVAEWKSRGELFSVRENGVDLYPAYQFDASGKPLPIIKDILSAYGSYGDGWALATWFHYPNGWIAVDGPGGASPVAPKDALDRHAAVINAARHHNGTYVA